MIFYILESELFQTSFYSIINKKKYYSTVRLLIKILSISFLNRYPIPDKIFLQIVSIDPFKQDFDIPLSFSLRLFLSFRLTRPFHPEYSTHRSHINIFAYSRLIVIFDYTKTVVTSPSPSLFVFFSIERISFSSRLHSDNFRTLSGDH